MKHPNRFLKYSDKNKQNTNFHKKGNSLDPNKEQKIDIDDCQTQLSNLITQFQKNTNSNNKIHYTSNEERLFSFSPNRIIKDKVLPPNKNNDKKTLVLDLDETLVHSGFNPFIPSSDIILKIKLDNNIHDIHVLIRPGVEEFINKMSQFYEIVIFTASLSKYADPLLDIIDKNKKCSYRLFREHCTLINGVFVKDLKKLDRDLKNVIIVDNSPLSYAFNPENGFPILSWYEDKDDKELFLITPVLEFLSKVDDVRKIIIKIVEHNEINFNKFNEEVFKFYNNNNINNIEKRGNLRGIKLNENEVNQVNMKVINNLNGEKSVKNINSFRKNIQNSLNNNFISTNLNLIISNNNKGKYNNNNNNPFFKQTDIKIHPKQIKNYNNHNLKKISINRPATSNLSLHHKKSLSLNNNNQTDKNSYLINSPLFKKSTSSKTIKITPLSMSYQTKKNKNYNNSLQRSFGNMNFSPLFLNHKFNHIIKPKSSGRINNSVQINIPKTPQFKDIKNNSLTNDIFLKFKVSNTTRYNDKNQKI